MPPPKPLSPRRKRPKVAYLVRWDETRRRYVVLDDGVLLGLSDRKGLAMEITRTTAIKAAQEHQAMVTVMVEDDVGRLKKQWTFTPPGKAESKKPQS